jgi:hypothetical protein
MTGGSGRDKGALAEVLTVLGMGRAAHGRPMYGHTWRTCAWRRRGRSATGLYTLVIAADPVLVFEARGICDER